MEKVLVTGASGYVGREVVGHLLSLGREVVALDLVPPDQNIPFIEVDLTDAASLEKALASESFECIFHLASLPGDTGNPQQMIRVNVNGCLNLLEFARKVQVKRFVLTSSISAYEWYPATKFNPPDYMPVDENHTCRPKDIYSVTKYTQELLAMVYHRQYRVPATVLRLTAVVGPYGRGGGRGYRDFAEKLAEGKRVQVPHFSADELCHYVDVRDVARLQIVVSENPAAIGEIFNCCGPAPTRGSEFVEIVERLVPKIKGEYGFPWSMAQGGEIAFDMSKAMTLLDFKPVYSLEDSIRSILDWIDAGGLAKEVSSMDRSYGAGVDKD